MSTVWDRTAEFLSDNLAALTPIVLLGLFVPIALFGSLMPLIGSSGQAGGLALGVVTLLLAVVTSWAKLAITALVFDPAGGRGPATQTATRRLLPVLGIGLVTLVMVIALSLPMFIALGVSGIDMNTLATSGKISMSDGVNGGVMAFVVFYAILLVPMVLWVYARFLVLLTPILIMERRGLGVYRRNMVLTRGIAWKVVGVLLLYVIVSWVAATAAKTVFGSVFALTLGGDGPVTLASVLTQIVAAGISTIFSVLAVAFVAKLYLATRDAREAIIEAS